MRREPATDSSIESPPAVAVLGATGLVGRRLLERLQEDVPPSPVHPRTDSQLLAFSRSAAPAAHSCGDIQWHRLPANPATWRGVIPFWIAACPLWAVAEQFPLLEAAGARRLVALSSTSRFTKRGSAAAAERAIAARLAAAEDAVLDGARARGIAATILRPTMIYDGIHDRNVAAIAGFIRRFGFFPVAGAAGGRRQPLHADDVAAACLAALACDTTCDAYDLSGGETLSYRDMVRRIFDWLDLPPRVATIPAGIVRAAAAWLGGLPWLGSLATMAARMNDDLVFDHAAATRDFGFQPRPFALPTRRHKRDARVTEELVVSP
ncbi:MAG: NAD(P)-dependent oxidoreductase [Planctomycetia bacterium]